MGTIAVVTDSSANVPEDVAEALGILTVPVVVTFDGGEYRDGVDLTSKQAYRWLKEGKVVTTAAPALGDFAAAYKAGSQATLLLVVLTLEYVRRGGRLGEAAARLATNLRTRPLLNRVGSPNSVGWRDALYDKGVEQVAGRDREESGGASSAGRHLPRRRSR